MHVQVNRLVLEAKEAAGIMDNTRKALLFCHLFLDGARHVVVGEKNLPTKRFSFAAFYFVVISSFLFHVVVYYTHGSQSLLALASLGCGCRSRSPITVKSQDPVEEMDDAVACVQVGLDKRSRKGTVDRAEEGAGLGDHLGR